MRSSQRSKIARWTATIVLGVGAFSVGGPALANKPTRGCGVDFSLVNRAEAFAILEHDYPNGPDQAKNDFLDKVDQNADAWFCVKGTPTFSNFVDNTANH
jgi:hypothetical protein